MYLGRYFIYYVFGILLFRLGQQSIDNERLPKGRRNAKAFRIMNPRRYFNVKNPEISSFFYFSHNVVPT